MAYGFAYICQESENVLPISYADYQEEKELYVKTLCNKIFSERGFSSNPWDRVIFKRR